MADPADGVPCDFTGHSEQQSRDPAASSDRSATDGAGSPGSPESDSSASDSSAGAPLVAWVRGYLDHLAVERGLSANTLAAYRRDLNRYIGWLCDLGIASPDQVDAPLLAGYERFLATGDEAHRPLAASSIARAMVAIRRLHAFAVAEGLATHDPAAEIHPPKTGKRLPRTLTIDQVASLLDSVERETPIGLRDAALLEMLYGTGTRISEVLGLDVDDLTRVQDDPDAGLRVTGKGNKQRMVPFGSYARSAVDAWLVRGRPALATSARRAVPALFLNTRGARLSRQSAWEILQTRAQQAGIAGPLGPHSLRHSFATHLLDGGADIRVVQELLGHASVTTTQIYTEVTAQHLREVYASAHPRARG